MGYEACPPDAVFGMTRIISAPNLFGFRYRDVISDTKVCKDSVIFPSAHLRHAARLRNRL